MKHIMNLTQADFKRSLSVSKLTGKPEIISCKRRDGNNEQYQRDIKIDVVICAAKDVKQDIYPYIKLVMIEEELTNSVIFGVKELKEAKETFNKFINQSEKSFLESFHIQTKTT